MESYLCVDGPLQGRCLRWRKPPLTGQMITAAFVEVEHGVMEAIYEVERIGDAGGLLWFDVARPVAARRLRRLRATRHTRHIYL